jgi:hypothetical protein
MTASDKTKDGGSHTPGPYAADALPFHRDCWSELNDGSSLNVVRRGADVLAVVWCADDDNETQEAQAKLFAAAPTMLEALPDLSAVIAWLENGCEVTHAVTELRIHQARIDAARSKATGDA